MPAATNRAEPDPLAWVDAHRLIAGSVLLVTLAIGLYGYYPFIVDDWPRLENWQRAAIWIADVTAVALVVEWMLATGKDETSAEAADPHHAKRRLQRIALSLLLTLVIDIAVTSYGVLLEKQASERTLPAAATVVRVQSIPWQPVRHHKLTIEFDDANGKLHKGLLVFTRRPEGFPAWVDQATRQAIDKGVPQFPIKIRYDPQRPPRVWAAAESWNRGQALAYGFGIIHLFQLILVGMPSVVVLFGASVRPSPYAVRLMPMLALAVEAVAMAFWGMLFRYRGF